jgi:hypothetical protein
MIRKVSISIYASASILIFSSVGMENLDTYPCDNCLAQKTTLVKCEMARDGVKCLHILCKECENSIFLIKKSTDDRLWCHYCSYFCNQYKKQCWQTADPDWILTLKSDIRASFLKKNYPNRVLPNISEVTAPHSGNGIVDTLFSLFTFTVNNT